MEQINVDGFDPDVCVIIPPEKCDRRSVEDLMLQNLGVNCRVEGEELFNFVKRFVPEVERFEGEGEVDGFFQEYFQIQSLAKKIFEIKKKVWEPELKAFFIRWLCILVEPSSERYSKVKEYKNYERFRQFANAVDIEMRRFSIGLPGRIGKIAKIQEFLRHRFGHCWYNNCDESRRVGIVDSEEQRFRQPFTPHQYFPQALISSNNKFPMTQEEHHLFETYLH